MRVEVWCERSRRDGQYIAPMKAWKGDLPAIPRQGDYINVQENGAVEEVRSVTWDLAHQVVLLTIRPDWDGEYGLMAAFREKQQQAGSTDKPAVEQTTRKEQHATA